MEKAVSYWLRAGQQALARSAMAEAVAQFRKGLDVLATLPEGPPRRQQELDLQIALVSALTATRGWAGAAVAETPVRARMLAEQLHRPDYLVPLMVGQWTFHQVRAEHKLALSISARIREIGEAQNDSRVQSLGHMLQGIIRFLLGDFVSARALLERCMGLADPAHRTIGRLSIDLYLAMLPYLALTLALLGQIDQARSWMGEALSIALPAKTYLHTRSCARVREPARLVHRFAYGVR